MKLYSLLKKYSKKHVIAMHMPGHKRHKFLHNSLPYDIDITEIDGFDNLHNPNGILKERMEFASKLYKTKRTYFLVNGSTCGILASIKSVCENGDEILIAKNCHKSVFHAIELMDLKCSFIPSHFDDETKIHLQIYPEDVDLCLKNNRGIKCVLITSPTYEGVISNIEKIAEVVHKYNIPLIVDEAHGAHLYLTNNSACQKGADIVINSLHKTLPSLTQTALLHICSDRIDAEKVSKSLSIFESSSPSYVLMASIDECITFMSKFGEKYFARLQKNLDCFKEAVKNLKNLKVLGYTTSHNFYDFDMTKIVILTSQTNIDGEELMRRLRAKNIELEMSYVNYAIAITTIFDTKKDLLCLAKALNNIDKTLENVEKNIQIKNIDNKVSLTINQALKTSSEIIDINQSIGKVCAEYVYVYPPGIPILIPGQIINQETCEYIKYITKHNLNLISSTGLLPNMIKIVSNT